MAADTTTTTTSAHRRQGLGRRFTLPLLLACSLNPINSSLIATALVPASAAVGVTPGSGAILISSLYVTTAIALPAAGRVAEIIGPRRVFLSGFPLVICGGIVGATASSLAALIVARVIIGLGTSTAFPSAMMLVARRAEALSLTGPPSRTVGALQVAAFATAALGLPLGGVLTHYAGWRSVFVINVPLGTLALLAAIRWIPQYDRCTPLLRVPKIASKIGGSGLALFAGALASMLIFAQSLPEPDWRWLAAGSLLAVLHVRRELRSSRPFIDIRLLVANAALTRTYLRFGLVTLGGSLLTIGLPMWLQAGHGYTASTAGILLLPVMVLSGMAIMGVSAGGAVRGSAVIAGLAMLASGALMWVLPAHPTAAVVLGATVLGGLSLGAGIGGNQIALYAQASSDALGSASGLFRSFGAVASITAAAVVGVVNRHEVTDKGLRATSVLVTVLSLCLAALTVLDWAKLGQVSRSRTA